MRALITGCAGFIGSHLTEALLGEGNEVLGIDCFNDNYPPELKVSNLERARSHDGFELAQADLASEPLEPLLDGAEVIFHLAAEPGVRPSWGAGFGRYVKNNITGTQRLLEAIRETGSQPRVVYSSSSSIYGDAARLPTPEDTVPGPISPYGATKLHGEHLCRLYHHNYGVNCVSLRYFTVYGPRQRPDMAFDIFCRAALEGRALRLYGDGRQTRDFTFVDDIVSATRAAAEVEGIGGRAFNVGGGSRISLNEAIETLARVTGERLEVEPHGEQAGDVHDTGAEIRAARELLGFEPRTTVEEGLERQWEWIKRNAAAGVG